jgi:hypothetical protein
LDTAWTQNPATSRKWPTGGLKIKRRGRGSLCVGLGSELDPAYVAEPRDLTGAAGLDDHAMEKSSMISKGKKAIQYTKITARGT